MVGIEGRIYGEVRVGVDPLVGFMEEKYSIIYCLSLQIFLYNMYDGV
jgi:hypothetical protein